MCRLRISVVRDDYEYYAAPHPACSMQVYSGRRGKPDAENPSTLVSEFVCETSRMWGCRIIGAAAKRERVCLASYTQNSPLTIRVELCGRFITRLRTGVQMGGTRKREKRQNTVDFLLAVAVQHCRAPMTLLSHQTLGTWWVVQLVQGTSCQTTCTAVPGAARLWSRIWTLRNARRPCTALSRCLTFSTPSCSCTSCA